MVSTADSVFASGLQAKDEVQRRPLRTTSPRNWRLPINLLLVRSVFPQPQAGTSKSSLTASDSGNRVFATQGEPPHEDPSYHRLDGNCPGFRFCFIECLAAANPSDAGTDAGGRPRSGNR